MAEYYVLLGDVVHSRDIENREAFQEHLADICGRFTAERRDDVYGNFKILKGVDEFGGVLQSLENLYEVVTAFHDGLLPHEVRIAVASGDIDVGLTSFDVEKMDGDAFHRATRRVEELEDESMVFDLLLGEEVGMDGADRSRTGDADLGRAIADEMNLLLDLRSEWTDRQREVVAVRESVDTQTAAAEELGVTQQSVSNVLAGAKWPLVHAVEERLRETLQSHDVRQVMGRSRWPTKERTIEDWVSTLDQDYDVDEVSANARDIIESVLEEDVPDAPDGVFFDKIRKVTTVDLDVGSLHRELARVLRDDGHPAEALDEYESVLDRNPNDPEVFLEYAELATEQQRHHDALEWLVRLLEAAAENGTVGELVDTIEDRLDVVEVILENGEDESSVHRVLGFLVSFAQRTAGPAIEDVRQWGLVQHARLFEEPHERADLSSGDGPGWSVTDSYSTGLGFLLVKEPEAAVAYFEHTWRARDTELDHHDSRLADAAGVALLGCERVLGPAILDVPAEELRSEITDSELPLRAPAAWLFAHITADETTDAPDDDDEAPVEDDPDHEAFADLEARAFETLRDMIEQWAEAT